MCDQSVDSSDLETQSGANEPFDDDGATGVETKPPFEGILACKRTSPISGLYTGTMTLPSMGKYALDLRIDIDVRQPNSPVLKKLSGDVYQIHPLPFGRERGYRVYKESWIVDEPITKWWPCRVEITGAVRFWKGIHHKTKIHILIPWRSFQPVGPARVRIESFGGQVEFVCKRISDCFRDVVLEVDICNRINAAPTLPSYDTSWHVNRPADLPNRILSIEDAYREAGVCMTISAAHTVIDDSDARFTSWSVAELHDALELYFSQISGTWPKWQLWGLLAGTFDQAGVGGIMFDAASQYGGSGEPPERQGFAVFRSHQWFNNLVQGSPANQDQARAMRHFLYTYVHEAGHAFNMLHSWDKNRPDSLSWMNYDWKYDARHTPDSFWANFRFRFDDEELLHIRHGDRNSVIMGSDPWASGGHLENPPGADSRIEQPLPLEFLLRSKGIFGFMEPVQVELRLRNLSEDSSLHVNAELEPENGNVRLFIHRPDGRSIVYAPMLCKLKGPELIVLKPAIGGIPGEDRYSQEVFLGYGCYGFYFDVPGDYSIRAVYHGNEDLLVPSNILKIRVLNPRSKDEDSLAQDFFEYRVGMSLYLQGSQSPFLAKGMELLENFVDRFKESHAAAAIASRISPSYAKPFFRMEDRRNPVIKMTNQADFKRALALTESASKMYSAEKSRSFNLLHHDLTARRAEYHRGLGQKAEGKKEIEHLLKSLTTRGVNQPVLDKVNAFLATF